MDTFSSVMVTGHRPRLLNPGQAEFARTELARLAVKVRAEHGAREAISGLALGSDTWWALAGLDAGLSLAAYVPCEAQADRWCAMDRAVWRLLRGAADREVVVGSRADAATFHARNDAMLNDADLVVAVADPNRSTGGTAATMRKALGRGLPVVLVDVRGMRTSLLSR